MKNYVPTRERAQCLIFIPSSNLSGFTPGTPKSALKQNDESETNSKGPDLSLMQLTSELFDHVAVILHCAIHNRVRIVHLPLPFCSNRICMMPEEEKKKKTMTSRASGQAARHYSKWLRLWSNYQQLLEAHLKTMTESQVTRWVLETR